MHSKTLLCFIFILSAGLSLDASCKMGISYEPGKAVIYMQPDQNTIVIRNEFIERTFSTQGGFYTISFKNRRTAKEYSRGISEELHISINGISCTGRSFEFVNASVNDLVSGKELIVKLRGSDTINKGIDLVLSYKIYDRHALVRKSISISNMSEREVVLSNVDTESLHLVPSDIYMTAVYHNYGNNETLIPYTAYYNDPAVLLYNKIHNEGIILGNEAPGVLKRTDCYSKDFIVNIGMTHEDDDYPFRKYLMPGETVETPGTFIIFTYKDKWQDCFEADLGNYLRTDMGIKLFDRNSYPLFYYCTWIPFKTSINDKLLREVADSLEGSGVEIMLIDDGWQDNWGDYNSHPVKFPDGIEETCNYIRSKGIKPGMWFSIASINRSSKVFRQHPEWALKDKDGLSANVYCLDTFRVTMSMSSPWYDYIYNKISGYVRKCGLAYVKLDFAVSSSAYITDPTISGDYGSVDGKYGYKDQPSSYWALYKSSTRLFNDLKKEFPNLLVDCTFEVWGRYHIVDYALLQNADVDWLTNYEFDAPRGPLSIRQANNQRTKVIPAQVMMIGNQLIDSPMYRYTYQSVASGVQLLCGDPRKLSPEQKTWYKNWSDWYRRMDKRYSYSRFCYRSDIFDYPSSNNWDGCYRFNPERQGGVLFFYRNGSLNPTMKFPVSLVKPGITYHVYEACKGKDYGLIKGSELINSGLTITIDEKYKALVLGIEPADSQ